MTHVSLSSDFALYLELYLMYKHDTFGIGMTRFDLKINVNQSDLHFTVQYRVFDI